jgi:hypothetical protein
MKVFFIFLFTFVIAQCNIKDRREIRNLTFIELNEFKNTFVNLYKSIEFKHFIEAHSTFFPLIHNSPVFLPFHRIYIQQFELRFMSNLSFGVPYIDWAIDAKNVSNSIIFTENFFGQNDQDGNIINSNFSNIKIAFPANEILKRKVSIVSGYTDDTRQTIIKLAPTFSNFSKTLEIGIHGLYHSNMIFTMNTVYSPNDPLFFLHHSFIDKMWYEWQMKPNSNNFDSEYYTNKNFSINSTLPYFNTSVTSSLNTTCINYINTNISYNNDILPEMISLAFLKMNGFSPDEIQQIQTSFYHQFRPCLILVLLLLLLSYN